MNKACKSGLIVLLLVAVMACGGTGQSPEADRQPSEPAATVAALTMQGRLVGIDVGPAEDNDFDAAVALAKEAGAEVVSLSVFWDDIEVAPGVYDPAPNWLQIANLYYPAQGLKVALVISVLDTNQNRLPPDLQDKAFDDPEVIDRFTKLLDFVFFQIPDLELISLSIGNEVDIFLGASVQEWSHYEDFYRAAVGHVHRIRPGLPVGVKATFSGLTGDLRDRLGSLNRSSDVILVTYYPLKGDFTVREPSVVSNDINTLTALYPGRPVYFHETGYPSGPKCNSSEAKQAEFLRNIFAAWDAHADQIGLVIFTWLTDVSPEAVREMEQYYGLSNPAFLEYLGTLGLRTYPGTGADKAAFQALRSEIQMRSAQSTLNP